VTMVTLFRTREIFEGAFLVHRAIELKFDATPVPKNAMALDISSGQLQSGRTDSTYDGTATCYSLHL